MLFQDVTLFVELQLVLSINLTECSYIYAKI